MSSILAYVVPLLTRASAYDTIVHQYVHSAYFQIFMPNLANSARYSCRLPRCHCTLPSTSLVTGLSYRYPVKTTDEAGLLVISRGTSIVLLFVYAAYLLFQVGVPTM
jgi:hypothetical protein